jgi:UDP-galactopyranose mutase
MGNPTISTNPSSKPSFVIVGAGFFGLTIAERIAEVLGEEVLVVDSRNHIGGNAYSYVDKETGIEIHKYGTHIFHTSNIEIWKYINRFTSFNSYRHKVIAKHNSSSYFMPINLSTINAFFNQFLSPAEAKKLIAEEGQIASKNNQNSFEDKAINLIGPRLYEAFIKNYTKKQWETDPSDLPASIISRLPVRFNYNIDYFEDLFQGLPSDGYHSIFDKMVLNPLISVRLDTDFFKIRHEFNSENTLVVYTGALDRYFDYRHGVLGWRTLDLEIQRHSSDDVQGTAVVNYVDSDVPYTRVHEFKHLHPERQYKHGESVTMTEISRFAGVNDEPYYPINSSSDRDKLIKYRELMANENNVLFGGRLGTYQYLDMHMAIGSALNLFKNEVQEWWRKRK